MEILAFAAALVFLFSLFVVVEEKIRRMEKEIESCWKEFERLNKTLAGIEDVKQSIDKQERLIFDGMNNILNYDLNQARKAARDHAEE